MRHWRWILTLLFVVLVALASAQTFQRSLPFLAKPASAVTDLCTLAIGNGYPTNIDGYAAKGWWVVQCNYTTNANGAVLKDLSTSALDLTNLAASSATYPIMTTNGLNGFSYLNFIGSGGYQLGNVGWTNKGAQEEIFMVVALTNIATQCRYYDGAYISSSRFMWTGTGGTTLRMQSGATALTACSLGEISNRWIVLDCVWNGANSTVYTNFVQGASGSAGTAEHHGLRVGMRYDAIGESAAMKLAEFIAYPTNLTTALRSNVFNYLTNKYAISP